MHHLSHTLKINENPQKDLAKKKKKKNNFTKILIKTFFGPIAVGSSLDDTGPNYSVSINIFLDHFFHQFPLK